MDEFAEDEKLGPEELQKKIDKTNRKLIKKRDELAFISNRVRVHDLGQDRYRRRYHHFAYAGGVFVEAVESCEPWKLETQGIVLTNSKSLFDCECPACGPIPDSSLYHHPLFMKFVKLTIVT